MQLVAGGDNPDFDISVLFPGVCVVAAMWKTQRWQADAAGSLRRLMPSGSYPNKKCTASRAMRDLQLTVSTIGSLMQCTTTTGCTTEQLKEHQMSKIFFSY